MNTTTALRRTLATLCLGAALTAGATTAAVASPDASTSPPLSATSTPAEATAVDFVDARMGDTSYDGLCQRLVREAYAAAGVDITATASDNTSAQRFWDTTTLEKHPASTDVPAGALVFWAGDGYNPDGHVGIALGGDAAASSEERDNVGIHVFSIGARNAEKVMLGWVMPA